jgi:hypothetical protein
MHMNTRTVLAWFGLARWGALTKLLGAAALLLAADVLAPGAVATAQRPIPIDVTSTPPGATVFVDSAESPAIGVTPLKAVRVQKGAHKLIFRLAGYEDATVEANVAKSGLSFSATLTALATLAVNAGGPSAEGGTIRVDGEPAGALPYRAYLKPGRHLVQVGRDGHQVFSQWVDLTAAQQLSLSVVLEKLAPDTGSILVAGDVPGAAVYLDGEPKGVTPVVLDNVTPGEHTVEIRAEGLAPFRQAVRVLPRERANVSPAIKPAKSGGSLRVIANVPEASIMIDGEPVGRAPVTRELLRAGEHIVSASASGFTSAEQTVEVVEGEQRVISMRLEAVAAQDGRILVNSRSGAAKVVVDGQDRGETPVVIEKPTAGVHAIVVTRDGFEALRTTCETGPGKNCELDAVLEPLGAKVRVVADVAEAELLIDGESRGNLPWEGSVPAGTHRIEVRASGYVTHSQQLDLTASGSPRVVDVRMTIEGEKSDAQRLRERSRLDEASSDAVTHSARALPEGVAAVDASAGWPYVGEVRLNIGVLKNIDAGFTFRTTVFRLNEFELRAKYGYPVSRQISVGGQVKVGGGIGPGRDPAASEPPGADDHPVNAFFVQMEGLGTLHFSEHGAFTAWVGLDLHTDRYDWTGPDSDVLSARGLLRERQDLARFRLGGALELVLDRHWNVWGALEGILIGESRDILGDTFGFGADDTHLYFRLGATYKF